MTLQEIYNKTKEHLLKQNAKAMVSPRGYYQKVGCAYRGANGLQCAIGCHIPDDLYSPDMEQKGVRRLIEDYPETMKQIFGEDVAAFLTEDSAALTTHKNKWDFLVRLQDIHDSTEPVKWKSLLEALALEYDLKP